MASHILNSSLFHFQTFSSLLWQKPQVKTKHMGCFSWIPTWSTNLTDNFCIISLGLGEWRKKLTTTTLNEFIKGTYIIYKAHLGWYQTGIDILCPTWQVWRSFIGQGKMNISTRTQLTPDKGWNLLHTCPGQGEGQFQEPAYFGHRAEIRQSLRRFISCSGPNLAESNKKVWQWSCHGITCPPH